MQKDYILFIHIFLALIVAILYGGLLMSLPIDVFRDRDNYLRYAGISLSLLDYYRSMGVITFLANEPLWLLINAGLSTIFTTETVVRLIIFFPASITSWYVLRQNPHHFFWVLLVLILPQVIVHHICQLRQGLAIAVFCIGWFSDQKFLRIFFLLLTPFIHASFFIILAVMIISVSAKKIRLSADLRAILLLVVGIIVGFFLSEIGIIVGARQADPGLVGIINVSGLGFVFWGIVFVTMFMEGRLFLHRYAFEVSCLIFYLATYFISHFSARIYESVILFVLLAGLNLTHWRRHTLIVLVVVYGALQYIVRFNQPWFGWGV